MHQFKKLHGRNSAGSYHIYKENFYSARSEYMIRINHMGATKPNVHTHLPTDCAATLQVPAGLHATLRCTAHSTVTATEASVSSPCHAAVPASLVMSARQSWTIICCCWTVINPYGCYRLPERISCMPLFGLPSFTFFLLFYY
jgi:hypothetical protein